MSQLFREDGRVIPVTLLSADPNIVTQVKTEEKDGYTAVQVGMQETKESRLSKPERGHLKGIGALKHLQEFRVEDVSSYERGNAIAVDTFSPGDVIRVSGVSIGKGFQGVVKRHGFSGGPKTHGHRHALRSPGSIGSAYPQKVMKGKKMAGRTGGDTVTVKNLTVERVDTEEQILFVSGAVPGKPGAVIRVEGQSADNKSQK